MKKLIILLICFCTGLQAQSQVSSSPKIIEVPLEQIFVHHTSSFLISGDRLYYKLYCLNKQTKKLSNISKIAYIELVSNSHEVVFKHKIRMDNGQGQGDYFIPSAIPSGNYKLIAYTQWMRNASITEFFQDDIVIVNPFQNNQSAVFKSGENQYEAPEIRDGDRRGSLKDKATIKISLAQEKFVNRDCVNVKLITPENLYGAYSVSVRKEGHANLPRPRTAADINVASGPDHLDIDPSVDQNYYLPELRGELIKGIVRYNSNGMPAKNVKVGLSIPDQNFIFKISSSDEKGAFYFNLENEYRSKNALVQIIDNENDTFSFELLDADPINYAAISFGYFSLDKSLEEMILQNSINNQVENAYASSQADHFQTIKAHTPFFNKPSYEYLLDDYTRFPTIKETILEVVEQAYTRQKDNKYTVHLRVYNEELEQGLKALLLIDGLFIPDHNVILDAKASKIKKISVLNESYIYGTELFEGIISMESFNRDFLETVPGLSSQAIEMFKPLEGKNYYQKVYSKSKKQARIPDNRTQLYWNPSVKIEKENIDFHFYTSDLNGDFEITIQGFSHDGSPVFTQSTISVR